MAYNRFLGQNGFRGVDFTSHPSLVHPDRLADALNVWKDYRSGQGSAIETFPGYRKVFEVAGKKVNGIFRFRSGVVDCLLLHIGEDLYSFSKDHNRRLNFNDVVKLKNAKSSGFQFGDKFYIIDGKGYYRVQGESLDRLGLYKYSDLYQAYIPTTFINGVEHEQRNMLVDQEVQEYIVTIASASGGVDFEFTAITTGSKEGECTLKKCISSSDTPASVVVVPQIATVDGVDYTVTSIGQYAFSEMSSVKTVVLPPSIRSIDQYAFAKCTLLEEVYCKYLTYINAYAFLDCVSLASFYTYQRGRFTDNNNEYIALTIAENAFKNAGAILTETEKTQIVLFEGLTDQEPDATYITNRDEANVAIASTKIDPFPSLSARIPIFSPCKSILSVKIDSEDIGTSSSKNIYYTKEEKDGLVTAVVIQGANTPYYTGKTAKITLESSPSKFASSNYTPFLSAQSGYAGTAQAAILGCTICAQFDGRVFFTGNPALPNTVFYTHRDDTGHNNPFYIGTYNYFDTGIGQTPNTAMIATGSNLIVFKSDTIQDGAINLYQGVDGTDNILPRYYVRQQGLAGVGCLGAACNFADDPVFISKRGLDAVGLQTVNLERSVQHRSTNVDRKLTSEDLAHAQMTEWEGYLVLLVPGGRVYLADSRQLFTNSAGYMEYEWYFLDDIGAYENDTEAFAFSSVAVDGYDLHPSPDTLVSVDRLDTIVSTGVVGVWYLPDGDKNYLVYKTGERVCKNQEGVNYFSPASCIVGFDEHLIFGTENGAICVFNTDKRGTMEANDNGIDTRDIIPRKYFDHMGHRYLSTIILALENAGVPNMAKNTVKRTVVLKAKDIFGSVFKWNVRTDRKVFKSNPDVAMAKGEISNGVPDTDFLEFQYINFDTSYDGALIVLNEKKKRYVEKQYAFFSDGFCRPFGIYHISYQYEIQGKVKNR